MGFTMPVDTDIDDAIDRAIHSYGKGVPISFENLHHALRQHAASLEICEAVLDKHIRERADALDVELVR